MPARICVGRHEEPPGDPAAEYRPQQPLPTPGAGRIRKPGHHVAHLIRVAEVVAHEVLHREHSCRRLVAAELGDAKLLRPAKHVRGSFGVEMELVAEPKEEFDGLAAHALVAGGKDSQAVELARLGRAVASHADPAEQLKVAQPAPGSLHVRLQQIHRLAELESLLQPGPLEGRQERSGTAADAAAELLHELPEKLGASRQEPGLDQGAADRGVPAGQRAGLVDGPHAVAEDQPRVEHVADQPLRQPGERLHPAARVEDHQVHVGIRGHVTAPVTAVGHQGDPRPEAGGFGRLQAGQRVLAEIEDHFVPQVGDRRTELDAGTTFAVTPLEPLMPFGQPLARSQDMGTEPGHGQMAS